EAHELVAQVPAPEHREDVERLRCGRHVGMVQIERNAEIELDGGVDAGRNTAVNGGIGRRAALDAAVLRSVLEIDQRHVLVLPVILLELEWNFLAPNGDELDVRAVEARTRRDEV